MVNIQKIKAKMVEKKITQKMLAEVLNIDPSTLNRKINNIEGNNLTVKEAQRIANELELNDPSEYFFC